VLLHGLLRAAAVVQPLAFSHRRTKSACVTVPQNPSLADCVYRKPLHAASGEAAHYCALVMSILGTRQTALCAVNARQCQACSGLRVPSAENPNPLVATVVYKAARNIRETGGGEDIDVTEARRLMAFAIPFLIPLDGPAKFRAPTRETPPYTSVCRHLGANIGERECKRCRGNVRLKLFACGHPLHQETTIQECRHCSDYRPSDSTP